MTDVVGQSDGNRKQQKSLAALGVLQKETYSLAPTWPSGRLFVATSGELGGKMEQQRMKLIAEQKAFRYEVRQGGDEIGTWIIEVMQGEGWEACAAKAAAGTTNE